MTDKPDSYSGFNEYNPLLDTDSLKYDTDLQQAVLKTSHGRRAPPTGLAGAGTAQKGGFFSRMKNIFGRQKTTAVPPPGTSSGRLGTASRAAQQQNSVIGAPPGSASRRLQTGSATGQRRPTTAVQGAGFTTGALGSGTTTLGPSQFERKEETNEDKAKKLERTVLDLVEESCLAYEKNDTKLALEKSEEAMRNEKSLNRYREEQNLGESDLNLTGF
ncbi:unnamed protein product, partial [Rotaria sordida]